MVFGAAFRKAAQRLVPGVFRCHVAKAKVAIAPIYLRFPTDPAEDPTYLDVGRL